MLRWIIVLLIAALFSAALGYGALAGKRHQTAIV
jgi:uncharacterized membrane protein YtjA (UPF0391 family)